MYLRSRDLKSQRAHMRQLRNLNARDKKISLLETEERQTLWFKVYDVKENNCYG